MTEENRRIILAEVVDRFGRQEWFRDATVYDRHPHTGDPTLELKVNYIPIFERKTVLDFSMKHGLTEKFIVVDRDGNPVD